MAKPVKSYDVWFVAANTVYREVPFSALTDWAQQGRVSSVDKVRPAGSNSPWATIGSISFLRDFLYVQSPQAETAIPTRHAEELEPVEMDVGFGQVEEEETDPDMIPLIDISLVLLIFFMMTATVSSLSPIEVPGMKNASELRADPDSFTVHIDRNGKEEIVYAVRIADANPTKENSDLATLDDAVTRLTTMLGEQGGAKKPEVRIACHKDLPAERVHELAKKLQGLKDKQLISYYGAEVNEKAK